MNPGDLVQIDYWLSKGVYGTIIEKQPGSRCVGCWVLLETGEVRLIRVENLKKAVISESR